MGGQKNEKRVPSFSFYAVSELLCMKVQGVGSLMYFLINFPCTLYHAFLGLILRSTSNLLGICVCLPTQL